MLASAFRAALAVFRALALEPESCAELLELKAPLLASAFRAALAVLRALDAEPESCVEFAVLSEPLLASAFRAALAVLRALDAEPESCAELAAVKEPLLASAFRAALAVLRALDAEPESCAELAALKEPLLASACCADEAALNESAVEPARRKVSAMLFVPWRWSANWLDLVALLATELAALNWPAAARLRALCSLAVFDQLFASFELQRLSKPDALLRVICRLVESSLWLDVVAVFAISVLFSVFVDSELLKADARCSASWCARCAALVKFVALSNIDAIDSSTAFEVWLSATICSTLFLSSA